MGGDATFAGINFQARVAAYFATHLLAGHVPSFLDLGHGEKLTSIQLESTEPVDDILLQTSFQRRCLVNVKTTVYVSDSPKSQMASITDQIVRQWIHNRLVHAPESTWKASTNNADRIAIVVGPQRSAKFARLLSHSLSVARGALSLDHVTNSISGKQKMQFWRVFLTMIKTATLKHLQAHLPDEEIMALLRTVRVKRLDPDDEVNHQYQALESAVLKNQIDAPHALNRIRLYCAELGEKRGITNLDDLRSVLLKHRILLRDVAAYDADINRLRAATQTELKDLKERCQIAVPSNSGIKTIMIKRPVTEVIVEHCRTTSLLLTGFPGSGKSGLIYGVAERLTEIGHPVVVIAVDKHIVPTKKQLSDDLGLENDLVDVLRNWKSQHQGVIFIDALDANRTGSSEHMYRQVISEIMKSIGGWNVVASIREFDLRYGIAYRELFKCNATTIQCSREQFQFVSHVWVDQLTSDELHCVWRESHVLHAAYIDASEPLKELLHTPFNLFLLADILSLNHELPPSITVQTDLLDTYWEHRVTNSATGALPRQSCIRALTKMMLSQHQFQVQILDSNLPLRELTSLAQEGVLKLDTQGHQVAFSHHILFDYSVGTWLQTKLAFSNSWGECQSLRTTHYWSHPGPRWCSNHFGGKTVSNFGLIITRWRPLMFATSAKQFQRLLLHN